MIMRHKLKMMGGGTALFLLLLSISTIVWAKSARNLDNGIGADSIGADPQKGLEQSEKSTENGQEEGDDDTADEIDIRIRKLRKTLNSGLRRILNGLPAKDGGWCGRMTSTGGLDPIERIQLQGWTLNETKLWINPPPDEDEMCEKEALTVQEQTTKCAKLKRLLPFPSEPLSEEERQFPLAYGLLVHKSPLQVFSLISAIYQPQNAYCLVMDEKADDLFKKEMQMLADCFPNIFLMSVGKIFWCKFGIVRAVFGCLRYLAELNHDWRYFQYLSGVDLPLKTNFEMVRILKRLNGTVNADVLPFEQYRVRLSERSMRPPLTLWKSSLSALIPRQAANTMLASGKVRHLFNYLQYTWCSDESLWATIAGNPQELKIPGGFNASSMYANLLKEATARCTHQGANSTRQEEGNGQNDEDGDDGGGGGIDDGEDDAAVEPFRLSSFYISRYQLWNEKKHWQPLANSRQQSTKCNGKFSSESCVFGVADVPSLIRRPELVVHKMYLDFQPAAYFCLWKSLWERAIDREGQQKFQGRVYSNLPAVKLARGEPEENVHYFFDQTCHLSISGK